MFAVTIGVRQENRLLVCGFMLPIPFIRLFRVYQWWNTDGRQNALLDNVNVDSMMKKLVKGTRKKNLEGVGELLENKFCT